MRGVGTVNYSSLQLSDRLTIAYKAQNNPRPCIPLYCTRSNTSDGIPSVTPLLKGVPNHTECTAFCLLIYIEQNSKINDLQKVNSRAPKVKRAISLKISPMFRLFITPLYSQAFKMGGTYPPISKIPQL